MNSVFNQINTEEIQDGPLYTTLDTSDLRWPSRHREYNLSDKERTCLIGNLLKSSRENRTPLPISLTQPLMYRL